LSTKKFGVEFTAFSWSPQVLWFGSNSPISPNYLQSSPIDYIHDSRPNQKPSDVLPWRISAPTIRHLILALLVGDTFTIADVVRTFQTPREAFDFFRNNKQFQRQDWAQVNVEVMRKAVWAKFTQHQDLCDMLMGTGAAKIVEHTTKDSFWGDGGDGSGKNMLGQLLMETRSRIVSELGKHTGNHYSSHDVINFYEKTEKYYEFTNFWEASIEVDGRIWPTSENYFQAQKGANRSAAEYLALLPLRDAIALSSKMISGFHPPNIDFYRDCVTNSYRIFFDKFPLLKDDICSSFPKCTFMFDDSDLELGVTVDLTSRSTSGHNFVGSSLIKIFEGSQSSPPGLSATISSKESSMITDNPSPQPPQTSATFPPPQTPVTPDPLGNSTIANNTDSSLLNSQSSPPQIGDLIGVVSVSPSNGFLATPPHINFITPDLPSDPMDVDQEYANSILVYPMDQDPIATGFQPPPSK